MQELTLKIDTDAIDTIILALQTHWYNRFVTRFPVDFDAQPGLAKYLVIMCRVDPCPISYELLIMHCNRCFISLVICGVPVEIDKLSFQGRSQRGGPQETWAPPPFLEKNTVNTNEDFVRMAKETQVCMVALSKILDTPLRCQCFLGNFENGVV